MAWTIRDVRTNAKLIETEYTRHGSATRSFTSRRLTPQVAYIADENWREREAARTNLINLEQFGLTNKPDHFLHVSVKSTFSDFLVSYTADPIKGSKNLQVAGRKIGKYLTEFFPGVDANTLGHAITAAMNRIPVDIARSAKDIRAIYEECHSTQSMNSCMTYPKSSQWSSLPAHPVEGYGDSDLQLAYIRNEKGKITARAMIWEAKARYGRVYGPDNAKLVSLLQSAGFSKGSFNGAKLAKIPYTALSRPDAEVYVVPYVDVDRYVYLDDDDNIVISTSERAGARVTDTNGYATFQRVVDIVTGERLPMSKLTAVANPENGRSCFVETAKMAERTVNFAGRVYAKLGYPTDGKPNNVWVQVQDETGLAPFWYVSRNFHQSALSGDWIHPERAIGSRIGQISYKEFFAEFARCELTGMVDRRRNMTLMLHGQYWTRDAARAYGKQTSAGWVSKYHTETEPVTAAA